MNLYPLNLVLAVAVASATLFLGYLPPRLLAAPFFTRWTLRLAALWLALAAITPPEILHYYVLLALLGFLAWWRLHGDHGFRGKLWLCAAAGLGISLGPVLILAVVPGAWPATWPAWAQALSLASLYTGGAIPGLAFALYLFTRREASGARVRPSGYGKFLFGLIVARAFIALINFCVYSPIGPLGPLTWGFVFQEDILGLISFFFLLPVLGRIASKKVSSPRPSTAGPVLGLIIVLGFFTEAWALFYFSGL